MCIRDRLNVVKTQDTLTCFSAKLQLNMKNLSLRKTQRKVLYLLLIIHLHYTRTLLHFSHLHSFLPAFFTLLTLLFPYYFLNTTLCFHNPYFISSFQILMGLREGGSVEWRMILRTKFTYNIIFKIIFGNTVNKCNVICLLCQRFK